MFDLQKEPEELPGKYSDPRAGGMGLYNHRERKPREAPPRFRVVADNKDPLCLGRLRAACDMIAPGGGGLDAGGEPPGGEGDGDRQHGGGEDAVQPDKHNEEYVIIGYGKNTSGSNGPPHFATVRPGFSKHPQYGPMLANMGKSNGIKWVPQGVGTEKRNRILYCLR